MPVTQGLHFELRRMIPPLGTYNDIKVLAANAAENVTVPANASYVLFSATADFIVRLGGAAEFPAGDIADGTGGELNPTARAVTPGDVLSVVSNATCTLGISWRAAEGVSQ